MTNSTKKTLQSELRKPNQVTQLNLKTGDMESSASLTTSTGITFVYVPKIVKMIVLANNHF